jgi:acyl-CoA reductase-like NAD-dependent aldehyde dehydrogenase
METPDLVHSINPATEEVLATFASTPPDHVEQALCEAERAFRQWRQTSFTERSSLMQQAAASLRQHEKHLASLITAEMGKPIAEAEAEVKKCAWTCEYYAEQTERLLAEQPHLSNATESYLAFPPLGTVLAIMPWNYPLWQVFRFAAPALMAGNTAVLKHASNVPQCALAAEEVFRASGFPSGVFRTLVLSNATALRLIDDRRIAAVTLTGSDRAGSQVAAAAGRAIKKTVLELGGTDPFIVLADADLAAVVETGVQARYQNAGQSCVAAKRFIVVAPVFAEFQERFVEAVRALRVGDPTDRVTQVGPLAREIEAGFVAINGRVASDPRLPFGGVKRSGYGRELSEYGIREFVNVQTVWIGPAKS